MLQKVIYLAIFFFSSISYLQASSVAGGGATAQAFHDPGTEAIHPGNDKFFESFEYQTSFRCSPVDAMIPDHSEVLKKLYELEQTKVARNKTKISKSPLNIPENICSSNNSDQQHISQSAGSAFHKFGTNGIIVSNLGETEVKSGVEKKNKFCPVVYASEDPRYIQKSVYTYSFHYPEKNARDTKFNYEVDKLYNTATTTKELRRFLRTQVFPRNPSVLDLERFCESVVDNGDEILVEAKLRTNDAANPETLQKIFLISLNVAIQEQKRQNFDLSVRQCVDMAWSFKPDNPIFPKSISPFDEESFLAIGSKQSVKAQSIISRYASICADNDGVRQ